MKTEDEITKLHYALITLEDAPEWFIDKVDLDAVRKTLAWILGD